MPTTSVLDNHNNKETVTNTETWHVMSISFSLQKGTRSHNLKMNVFTARDRTAYQQQSQDLNPTQTFWPKDQDP